MDLRGSRPPREPGSDASSPLGGRLIHSLCFARCSDPCMKTFLASLIDGGIGGNGPGARLDIYRRVLTPSVVS
jgi:hypothetical protein